MTKLNAKWTECEFGLDTDGKLKLIVDVEADAKIPKPVQLILAFSALASVAVQSGMDKRELMEQAFKDQWRVQ